MVVLYESSWEVKNAEKMRAGDVKSVKWQTTRRALVESKDITLSNKHMVQLTDDLEMKVRRLRMSLFLIKLQQKYKFGIWTQKQ